jgi:phospholipid-binding lipoprotein MlaA
MKIKACLIILSTVLIAGCAASKKNQSVNGKMSQWVYELMTRQVTGLPPIYSSTHPPILSFTHYAPPADDDFNLLEDELAQQQVKVADPLKPLNRAMHNVNDKLYFKVLRPVARACKRAVPKPARISIRNFFNNLTTPARYVSCLLQGKRKAAGTELHRFALNTTVGVLGFADPAQEKWKLAPTDEDLGQTLGKWGVGNGVYVVLPLLGPSTVRDTLGLIGGQLLNPVHYVEPTEVSLAISAGKIANENTFTIGRYESFKSAAVDPYTAMRQAYIQYRDKQVKD